MAVKPNFDWGFFEVIGCNIAFPYLSHKELVEQQGVVSKAFGFLSDGFWHKVWIFVAETQYAGGLDADKWCVVGDEVSEKLHVACGVFLGQLQAAFRYGGTPAFNMLRYYDVVTQTCKQCCEGDAQLCLHIVCELIGEKIDGAAPGLGIKTMGC